MTDAKDQFLNAFKSVNALEKILFGPLIRRQVRANRLFDREIANSGVDATLLLCRARASQAYLFVLAVLAMFVTVLGFGQVAAGVLAVAAVFAVIGVKHSLAAARVARQWRATDRR